MRTETSFIELEFKQLITLRMVELGFDIIELIPFTGKRWTSSKLALASTFMGYYIDGKQVGVIRLTGRCPRIEYSKVQNADVE